MQKKNNNKKKERKKEKKTAKINLKGIKSDKYVQEFRTSKEIIQL